MQMEVLIPVTFQTSKRVLRRAFTTDSVDNCLRMARSTLLQDPALLTYNFTLARPSGSF